MPRAPRRHEQHVVDGYRAIALSGKGIAPVTALGDRWVVEVIIEFAPPKTQMRSSRAAPKPAPLARDGCPLHRPDRIHLERHAQSWAALL
jgi:hypothetical protein